MPSNENKSFLATDPEEKESMSSLTRNSKDDFMGALNEQQENTDRQFSEIRSTMHDMNGNLSKQIKIITKNQKRNLGAKKLHLSEIKIQQKRSERKKNFSV